MTEPGDIARNITDLLRERIMESGMDMRQIAHAADMNLGTLERRMAAAPGLILNPFRITELISVCQVLKVDLSELWEVAQLSDSFDHDEPAPEVVEVRTSYVATRDGLNPAGYAITVSNDDRTYTVHAIDEAAASEGRRTLGIALANAGQRVA